MSNHIDIFGVADTPTKINTLYTRAARVVEMFSSAKKLNKPLWCNMYEGAVSSYDITGKGVQSRFLFLEQRRLNARFTTDWQQHANGCDPRDFTTQTLSRPGVSEKWAYLFRMQKNTPFYSLENIAANTLNLAKRIEQDMEYLMEARYDIYNEFFMFNHLANSDRHFTTIRTSAPGAAVGTGYFSEKTSTGAPMFKWASAADKCSNSTDLLFLAPGLDSANIQPLTVPAIKQLQNEMATLTRNYDLGTLTIITDAFTQEQIIKNDSGLVNALLWQAIQKGTALRSGLASDHNIVELVDWKIDPLPWRGYRFAAGDRGSGATLEHCIKRIDPWLDVATEEGLETVPNPDYLNPDVATFQIDVPWVGETYSPMRAVVPDSVNKIKNTPQNWAQWEWLNIRDNDNNPFGDKGYFSLRDNLMAAPEPKSRISPIILTRRYPMQANIITLPALTTYTLPAAATSTTTCETVQWTQDSPDCLFNASDPAYPNSGSTFANGGCTACQ
jgi:hypothetical protein